MILNFSVYPTKNLGDDYSSPVHYFTFGEPVTRVGIGNTQVFEKVKNPSAVIIGGGGLVAPFALESLRNIFSYYKNKCPIIGWGIGINFHSDKLKNTDTQTAAEANYEILDKFDFLGIRDHLTAYDWLPCSSCLHPFFSFDSAPTREFVIYEHRDHPIPISEIPKMNNFHNSLKEVVEFFTTAECIITNSYHGVYWATLLNRKVICIPFSTRFMSTKFPPIYISEPGDYKDAAKSAKSYPKAREICIRKNLDFYNRITNMII